MDIISTKISNLIRKAATAAAKPLISVASAGVPVLDQTWEKNLKDTHL